MEAKTNYTVVGFTVLVLIAGLLAAALWLSVGFHNKKYNIYAVYFHEAVSGLSEESAVKYNGVQVGYVKRIQLNRWDPQQVKILLDIEAGTPITTTTTATLLSQGITGNTYVGLSATSSDLTPLQKLPQEPYPIIPSKPSLLKQLDRVLKDVSDNINGVSIEIKKVFGKENVKNLKDTLANLKEVTSVIADNRQNINQSIKNADILLKNMAESSKQFPAISKDLKTGVKKFINLADDLKRVGEDISATMSSGKSALDKFSQDTLPPAIRLLRKLNTLADTVDKLGIEIKQNPSVVIRGTTPPPPGPGE